MGEAPNYLDGYPNSLPQQRIVGPDLSVDLTAVSDDPFSFQRPFRHALMDGGFSSSPLAVLLRWSMRSCRPAHSR